MEQIDYKEKYEQAMERARQFFEKPYLEDSAGIVEYIFPELKESEDEKIRKELLDYCKNRAEKYPKRTLMMILKAGKDGVVMTVNILCG